MNDQQWQRFMLVAVVAAIGLLFSANVLLVKLIHDNGGKSARPARATTTAAVPELPAPSSNGSSRALLREIDRTKKQLRNPFEQTLFQLQSVSSSTATLTDLPPLLNSLVIETGQLAELSPQFAVVAKRMKTLNKEIATMAGSMQGLGPVLVDFEQALKQIETDTARIRECTEKPTTCS